MQTAFHLGDKQCSKIFTCTCVGKSRCPEMTNLCFDSANISKNAVEYEGSDVSKTGRKNDDSEDIRKTLIALERLYSRN